MTSQVGEDHRDLRVSYECGELNLDVVGHLLRRTPASKHVTDKRHRDSPIRPHWHRYPEIRVAPYRYLNHIVDANQIFLYDRGAAGGRRRRRVCRNAP